MEKCAYCGHKSIQLVNVLELELGQHETATSVRICTDCADECC